ncbi:hypothetical protein [Pseudonocardia humida]|uniref:Luciferase-like monooxygenase n=1 Tax=Pseudonocardia humida TaxID=2800819 RepID=A0ABT0ZTN3_9PSEU|nr:hypothetical protein [Pseudonocardia humida]MCO1654090.1 hypothetical protein [Pseudonocardia humida]
MPVPHNLPTDRTPLFGRAAEIPTIAALVGGHRLVTLLGIGAPARPGWPAATATGRRRDVPAAIAHCRDDRGVYRFRNDHRFVVGRRPR